MHRRIVLAACALLLSAAGPALAQAPYPSKPITMIVPFPPGGLADIVARPVAEAMSRDLGQPVTIGAIEGGWDGWNPRLSIRGFAIRDKANLVLGTLLVHHCRSPVAGVKMP